MKIKVYEWDHPCFKYYLWKRENDGHPIYNSLPKGADPKLLKLRRTLFVTESQWLNSAIFSVDRDTE